MSTGTVVSLSRWPVKSMAGETVQALCLDRLGATGDRTHAIFDVFKGEPRRINAVLVPRLLAWSAAYPEADDEALARHEPPRPLVTAPDGTARSWEDPDLANALCEDLGRPVTLVREPRGLQDRKGTVHLTAGASLRALEKALEAPIDVRRFRCNLHLELDAEPFEEESWIGRRLRIGDAILEIVELCERCVIPTRDPQTQERWPQLLRWLAAERATMFGLIARVAGPAVVRRDDRVSLLA